ncbi:unnamed protein product [Victoria cruziana]
MVQKMPNIENFGSAEWSNCEKAPVRYVQYFCSDSLKPFSHWNIRRTGSISIHFCGSFTAGKTNCSMGNPDRPFLFHGTEKAACARRPRGAKVAKFSKKEAVGALFAGKTRFHRQPRSVGDDSRHGKGFFHVSGECRRKEDPGLSTICLRCSILI